MGASNRGPSPCPGRAQADLDLGNYERFLGLTLTREHNIPTGKVYSQVNTQRRGEGAEHEEGEDSATEPSRAMG